MKLQVSREPKGLFGWLIACWLAGLLSHEITIHVLPEQYFSLTTISRNNIFQSCRKGPKLLDKSYGSEYEATTSLCHKSEAS